MIVIQFPSYPGIAPDRVECKSIHTRTCIGKSECVCIQRYHHRLRLVLQLGLIYHLDLSTGIWHACFFFLIRCTGKTGGSICFFSSPLLHDDDNAIICPAYQLLAGVWTSFIYFFLSVRPQKPDIEIMLLSRFSLSRRIYSGGKSFLAG